MSPLTSKASSREARKDDFEKALRTKEKAQRYDMVDEAKKATVEAIVTERPQEDKPIRLKLANSKAKSKPLSNFSSTTSCAK